MRIKHRLYNSYFIKVQTQTDSCPICCPCHWAHQGAEHSQGEAFIFTVRDIRPACWAYNGHYSFCWKGKYIWYSLHFFLQVFAIWGDWNWAWNWCILPAHVCALNLASKLCESVPGWSTAIRVLLCSLLCCFCSCLPAQRRKSNWPRVNKSCRIC